MLTDPKKDFMTVYIAIGIFSAMLISILFIIGCFLVGKHFDKCFKSKLLSDDDYDDLMWEQHFSMLSLSTNWHKLKQYRFHRALLYMRCLMYPSLTTKKNTPYAYFFKGYNFRKHANLSSLVIGYTLKATVIFFAIYAAGYAYIFFTHPDLL